MGFVSGKGVRLFIDTSSGGGAPVWKTAHHETVVSMSVGSETTDVTTKDTSDFAAAIKTAATVTLNCTSKVADDASSTELNYVDILKMALETNADTGRGIRKCKMEGSKAGEPSVTFEAFVETQEGTFDVAEVGEYTFGLRVVTKPVVTTLAS